MCVPSCFVCAARLVFRGALPPRASALPPHQTHTHIRLTLYHCSPWGVASPQHSHTPARASPLAMADTKDRSPSKRDRPLGVPHCILGREERGNAGVVTCRCHPLAYVSCLDAPRPRQGTQTERDEAQRGTSRTCTSKGHGLSTHAGQAHEWLCLTVVVSESRECVVTCMHGLLAIGKKGIYSSITHKKDSTSTPLAVLFGSIGGGARDVLSA